MGLIPDKFAVMAVDPGGTTGLAFGIFDALDTLKETLQLAENIEAMEVYGESPEQAWTIADMWLDFAAEANLSGVALKDCHLVFEAFDLRTSLADLSPVEIIAAVRTLLMPRNNAARVRTGAGAVVVGSPPWKVDWRSQGASAAGWATSERLKGWGLYSLGTGSEHKRDALRHMAVRTRRVLDGKV